MFDVPTEPDTLSLSSSEAEISENNPFTHKEAIYQAQRDLYKKISDDNQEFYWKICEI